MYSKLLRLLNSDRLLVYHIFAEKESQVSLEIEHYQKEIMTLKKQLAELQNNLSTTQVSLMYGTMYMFRSCYYDIRDGQIYLLLPRRDVIKDIFRV